MRNNLSPPWMRWGMLVVLLVAAALRLWALPSFPVGLHYDEAANLILTRQIAEGQYRPVFIQAYTGKEVLFFYAAAPWVRMTGGSPWGLRLGAAMLGILTVAATYAATSALLGPRKRTASIALFAAAWIAVAFPHVLLSRYGFRAISQPLLQALTVAALWRGLRSGRWSWLVAGGAFLGLTAYTYLAARLFPVPLGIALGWLLVRSEPRARRRLLGQLALVLAVAMAALAPLGLFFLQHPEAFTTRITQVASPNWSDALRGIWLCLRALVWPGVGDGYVRFNLPHLPLMDVISALLALLGLVSRLRLRRKDSLGSAAFILVIGAIVVMILPSGLATGELTPSNLRMAGLFPFLALLPAWGLSEGLRVFGGMAPGKWQMRTSDGRPQPSAYAALLPLSLASLLFLGGAARTASIYARWSSSDALFRAADGEMVLAARALDAAIETAPDPAGVTVYIASEHYRHPTVAALAEHYGDAKWLTGGATLVLPEHGDAVYLVPDNAPPPAPWPKTISDVLDDGQLPEPFRCARVSLAPTVSVCPRRAAPGPDGATRRRPGCCAGRFRPRRPGLRCRADAAMSGRSVMPDPGHVGSGITLPDAAACPAIVPSGERRVGPDDAIPLSCRGMDAGRGRAGPIGGRPSSGGSPCRGVRGGRRFL